MATTSNSNFNPNWASPPGNTIDELLRERKISFNTLAKNLNADTDYLNNLIHGNIPLTEEIAVKLASHLGASAKFWLNRESHYRQSVDKLRENEEKKWLNNLPISEMVKLGWIPSNYSPGLLLEYFSVSNVWAWKSKYRKLFSTTSFRSSLALNQTSCLFLLG
ncbi:MAG: hypothetical protein IPL54_16965 [Chitinophagaceae bacterium]|nr:hypothetical protein [Chitinophagaceae bacterium]